MVEFGRILLLIGLGLTFAGLLILAVGKVFPWLGHLPGDIYYEGENFKIYFPFTTMLLISIVGSLLLNLFLRIFKR
jgi:hypothetical protein